MPDATEHQPAAAPECVSIDRRRGAPRAQNGKKTRHRDFSTRSVTIESPPCCAGYTLPRETPARAHLAATPRGVISLPPISVLDPWVHELLDSQRRARLGAGLRSGILEPRARRHRL